MAITIKVLGAEHPDVATLYHNLGGLEHARGRYARGEPFACRSVAIREKALGAIIPRWRRTWRRWPLCWTGRATTPNWTFE
jgi:hypothetical protein